MAATRLASLSHSSSTLVSTLGIASVRADELDRATRPGYQLLAIFDDLRWNLVVILQALPWVGAEIIHIAPEVGLARLIVCTKVQPSIREDGEERGAHIEAVAAKHGAAYERIELRELVQDKVLEG